MGLFLALPLLFVLLLVVGAVVAGVVVLIAGGRKARLIVGTVLLVGLVLVGLVGLTLVPVRLARPRQVRMNTYPARRVEVSARESARPGGPAIWLEADNAEFLADVYPSLRSAAKALAVQAAAKLNAAVDVGGQPSIVKVTATEEVSESDPNLLEAVVGVLRKRFHAGKASVEVATGAGESGATDDETTFVQVAITRRGVPSSGYLAAVAGSEVSWEAAIRLRHKRRTETLSTWYVDKEWVDNFARFASRQRGRRWIIARSDRPCATRQEAQRRALDRAAESVLELAPTRAVGEARALEAKGAVWERDQAADCIQRRGLIMDQFVQSFPRPYGGALWQHAVLVDASPAQMAAVAREVASAAAAERSAWVWGVGRRVLSIAAVMGAVLLAYVFLNAATKGYYEWALRVAAVVLLAGGVVLIWMVS